MDINNKILTNLSKALPHRNFARARKWSNFFSHKKTISGEFDSKKHTQLTESE